MKKYYAPMSKVLTINSNYIMDDTINPASSQGGNDDPVSSEPLF